MMDDNQQAEQVAPELKADPAINESAVNGLDFKPADINSRMFAAVIDMGLIMMLIWPLLMQVSTAMFGPFNAEALAGSFSALPDLVTVKARLIESGVLKRYAVDSLIQTVVIGALIVPFWVKLGATPGKYLLRMRIVDSETLKPLSIPRAILRYLCYASCVLSFGIGILWISLNKKRRAFHDLLAGTRVIILPKGKSGLPY